MLIVSPGAAHAPFVLVLDIGSSSLRALILDSDARPIQGLAARASYSVRRTPDGGSTLDAEQMLAALIGVLDELLSRSGDMPIAAVAAGSLASSLVGVDQAGRPLTAVYLYSDTRASAAALRLRAEIDPNSSRLRTGCPLHSSYLPAQLTWLRETQPNLFPRVVKWLSLHEFLLLKLVGRALISHSLASWTGLFNRFRLDWDDEWLARTGVRREQLSPVVPADAFASGLVPEYRERWPALADAPFFPAIGDGAAANLGSGCANAGRVAITIGTSAAIRVVVPADPPPAIPAGLWLYRVDERRALLGGSLNNGGNVHAYLRQTLRLPAREEEERELARVAPDGHGLTLLPFFAGERSPGYHGEARAAILGLHLGSAPLDLVRAALEAIAYRLAAIYDLMRPALSPQHELIASGGALLHSPVWVQILADVLGRAVTVSGEEEPTARGAALIALRAIGSERAAASAAALGPTFAYNPDYGPIYGRARKRHEECYRMLIEEYPLNDGRTG